MSHKLEFMLPHCLLLCCYTPDIQIIRNSSSGREQQTVAMEILQIPKRQQTVKTFQPMPCACSLEPAEEAIKSVKSREKETKQKKNEILSEPQEDNSV